MEKIDDVKLDELVTESATELVNDRRKQAKGLIKKQLQRMEALATERKGYEKKLKKLTGKLETAQQFVERLRSGDWGILVEQSGEKNE